MECETSLLAEMPETRQHFFLFFSRFFIFTRGGEAHLLAEDAKGCQYFFKDFLEIPLTADDPGIRPKQIFTEGNEENGDSNFLCFKSSSLPSFPSV
jgi:hypothetical protein